MKSITSHLSLRLLRVRTQTSPPQSATLARIIMMMSLVPLSGVIPNQKCSRHPRLQINAAPAMFTHFLSVLTRAGNNAAHTAMRKRFACQAGLELLQMV